MNLAPTPKSKFFRLHLVVFCVLLSLLFSSVHTAQAQQPQLSLADLLIALRSKKVTLAERNAILSEAVKQRGITFSLSADIEKELAATGADKILLDSIRQKNVVVKIVPTPAPVAAATPIPTPAPPDSTFYLKRADANASKGEYGAALPDYNKVVELKPDDAVALLSRGKAHYNLKSFDRALADFDRVIELDPKSSVAYLNRGTAQERAGNTLKAAVDYQKAIDLDAANEVAKNNLKRLEDEQQKAVAAAAAAKAVPTVVEAPVKVPEFINLGNLTGADATRMVTPIYSPIARRSNLEGRVTVEVELDVNGNVVEAKAVSGHQLLRGNAEDAAKRSKFKPAMFGGSAIKSIGVITYNFTLKADRN